MLEIWNSLPYIWKMIVVASFILGASSVIIRHKKERDKRGAIEDIRDEITEGDNE